MNPFEIIREQLGGAVPFARHAGVKLTHVEAGLARAELEQTATSVNHIGTQHAGALFTLGETASGGAMAGLFADRILNVRPIAGEAQVRYTRLAKGRITAEARVAGARENIMATFERDKKVAFDVTVTLSDAEEKEVATMRVSWTVKGA
ncbi:MAG: YiiD C-terminal domain-containing protein [Alphaproteobacteria bacterium]|nr:YiiD C-terminal domain-containing protein [Alphaproteobacteria bacterium]